MKDNAVKASHKPKEQDKYKQLYFKEISKLKSVIFTHIVTMSSLLCGGVCVPGVLCMHMCVCVHTRVLIQSIAYHSPSARTLFNVSFHAHLLEILYLSFCLQKHLSYWQDIFTGRDSG